MSARESSQRLERTTPITESPGLLIQLLNLTSQVVALRPERGSLVAKYHVISVKTLKRLRRQFRTKYDVN